MVAVTRRLPRRLASAAGTASAKKIHAARRCPSVTVRSR
jgi:hypothetical protein